MRFFRNILLITMVVCAVGHAGYIEYQFQGWSSHNPDNIATGINQFTMGVTNEGVGEDQAKFIFSNSGDEAGVVTEILFNDTLPQILDFDSFEYIAVVDNLSFEFEGLNGNKFNFGAQTEVSSLSSPVKNGINTGESLGIVFNLTEGNTFGSLLNSINSGRFDVLLHAQAFSDEGSEQFSLSVPVPEASTLSLLSLGLMLLFIASSYKNRKKKRLECLPICHTNK